MNLSAEAVPVTEISRLRDLYRHEMPCQIIHDSLHGREGWTQSYRLSANGVVAGYGSVAIGGPWKGKPAIFEFYALRAARCRTFELFHAFLQVTGVTSIETQTNDPFLTTMLHTFGGDLAVESILFDDAITTTHTFPGASFRSTNPADREKIRALDLDPDAAWLVEIQGQIAATGGILYHYNRPYGDVFMKVAEAFRRRGIGAFIVQELKRACYEAGSVPAARCGLQNLASRQTLQKAGFAPCGHLVSATVVKDRVGGS